MALAGAAAATYTIATGTTGTRIAGGPIPRAAATACEAPSRPSARRRPSTTPRRLANVLWISAAYQPGYPTKTVIEPNSHGHLPQVVLRGWRCSDGRLLRFWFADAALLPFTHEPAGSARLASTGSKRLTLGLARLRRQHFVSVGYFMFSSPGKWVVEARKGSRVLGTAVFDFSS